MGIYLIYDHTTRRGYPSTRTHINSGWSSLTIPRTSMQNKNSGESQIPSSSSRKPSTLTQTLKQAKKKFTIGFPFEDMSLQISRLFLKEVLKNDFYSTLYSFSQGPTMENFQAQYEMLYAKYPLQIWASSTYYIYNENTKMPQEVTPACVNNRHLFGRDLSEMKLIFALRAEAFLAQWKPLHMLTPQIRYQFIHYQVPIPPAVFSPVVDQDFMKIDSISDLHEWAENWYSKLATTAVTWLFLRQVITYRRRDIPSCFPPTNVVEPSYIVHFNFDGIPTHIRMKDNYPCYSWWNNETNYIGMRQVITIFMDKVSPEVLHRFLQHKGPLTPESEETFLPPPPPIKRSKGMIFTPSKIFSTIGIQNEEAMEGTSSGGTRSIEEVTTEEESEVELFLGRSALLPTQPMKKDPTQRALDGDDSDEEIEDDWANTMADQTGALEGNAEEDTWEYTLPPYKKVEDDQEHNEEQIQDA